MKTNLTPSPLSRLLTACGLFVALPFALLVTAIVLFKSLCYLEPRFDGMEMPYYIVCFFVGIALECICCQFFSHIFED